jgi:hypothetical protein
MPAMPAPTTATWRSGPALDAGDALDAFEAGAVVEGEEGVRGFFVMAFFVGSERVNTVSSTGRRARRILSGP